MLHFRISGQMSFLSIHRTITAKCPNKSGSGIYCTLPRRIHSYRHPHCETLEETDLLVERQISFFHRLWKGFLCVERCIVYLLFVCKKTAGCLGFLLKVCNIPMGFTKYMSQNSVALILGKNIWSFEKAKIEGACITCEILKLCKEKVSSFHVSSQLSFEANISSFIIPKWGVGIPSLDEF